MSKNGNTLVATICLYGTREVGHGWIAGVGGDQEECEPEVILGDGQLKGMGLTDTVWLAQDAVEKELGSDEGDVLILEPGGERQSRCTLRGRWYYGDLKWEPADMIVFTMVG